MSRTLHRTFSQAEDIIYILTAVALVGAAVTLLGYSIYQFISGLQGDLVKNISTLLDGLLLVMMLVEILHTVGIFFRKRQLVIEPFLAVGVIAAIRRVLIITAEQVHPSPEHAAAFRMTMLELGLLSAMILAFVLCIFLLRRRARPDTASLEER